jgi:serine/threonine protein kinase
VGRQHSPEAETQPYGWVGNFRLLERIGRGGMGEVFLAMSNGPTGFNKLVVLKLLREEFALNGAARAMFLDEGRLLARLNHPNVVQTNEVGVEGGDHYLVMEYLQGQSLDQLIKQTAAIRERVPLGVWVRIALDALSGLDYAHELADFDGTPLGVVHRDLSPHNVFLTYEGVVKLLDFGIAKAATQSYRTQTGTVKGKPGYMPPEQLMGTPVDRRADLYVVGIVLWEMFTGTRLFTGPPTQSLVQMVNMRLPRPSSVVPGFDPELEAVIMRALEKDTDARYQTAREMREALAAAASRLFAVPSREAVGELMLSLFREQRERRKLAVQRHVSEHLRGGATTREAARPPATPQPARRESARPPSGPQLARRESARPPAEGARRESAHPPASHENSTMGVDAADLLPASGAGGADVLKGSTLMLENAGQGQAPGFGGALPPTPRLPSGPAFAPARYPTLTGTPTPAFYQHTSAPPQQAARGRSPGVFRSVLVLCAVTGLAASGALVWLLRTSGPTTSSTAARPVVTTSPAPGPTTPEPEARGPVVAAGSAAPPATAHVKVSASHAADAPRTRASGRDTSERLAAPVSPERPGKEGERTAETARPSEPPAEATLRLPAARGPAAQTSPSTSGSARPSKRTFRTDL